MSRSSLQSDATEVLESSAWELTVLASHVDPEVKRQARCLSLSETPSLNDAPLRVLRRVNEDVDAWRHGAPERISMRHNHAVGGCGDPGTRHGGSRAGWKIPDHV